MANQTPLVLLSGKSNELLTTDSLKIHPTATTANGIPYTDGAGATSILAAGTNFQLLRGNTSGAPSFGNQKQTLIDMSSQWAVTNNDVGDTLISATSQPTLGNAQIQYTFVSGDIISGADFTDCMALVAFGGKNTDSSTRVINWSVDFNGGSVLGGTSLSPTTGSPWWASLVQLPSSAALAAGNSFGLRFWGSVTNVLRYDYWILFIIPRVLGPILNRDLLWQILGLGNTVGSWGMNGPTGTITGFTSLDGGTGTAVNSGNGLRYSQRTGELFNQGTVSGVPLIGDQDLAFWGASTNTTSAFNLISSINTTAKFYGLNTGGNMKRYYNAIGIR